MKTSRFLVAVGTFGMCLTVNGIYDGGYALVGFVVSALVFGVGCGLTSRD